MLVGLAVFAILVSGMGAETLRDPIKKKGAGPLFQIHHGKKWGYMDRSGKTAIPPQFDDEGDFFSGRAKVRQGKEWGYVDETGRVVVPLQFDNAGDFREGLAPVQSGRKWGFVDPAGRFAIEPQFQAAAEFSDGLARFEIWETIKCGPSDYKGKEDITYSKDNAPLFAFRMHDRTSGANLGCFPPDARYGFVDKRGWIAVPPRFLHVGDFSDGLAPARSAGSSDQKLGYIDRTGRMVIEPQFDQAYSFSEGLAAVEIGVRFQGSRQVAGSWGFIDRQGKFAVPARYFMADSFSEGLAAVSLPGTVSGYIDASGVFKIPPRYVVATAFSEGLALVWPEDGGDEYYIDRTGKTALALKLPALWPFRDGLTVAGNQGEQRYVDREGRAVAPYETDPQLGE